LPKRIDVTGQRFGRLIAIERDGHIRRRRLWVCKCDCGKTKKVPITYLTHGFAKSCGCLREEQQKVFEGMRFGKLLTVRRIGKKAGCPWWLCKCDCGKEKRTLSSSLISGKTKTCGCGYGHPQPWHRKRPYESLYNCFVRTAATKQRNTDLSYEQFFELTKIGTCFYCGGPIIWIPYNQGRVGPQAYNLDRKDNSKGYTLNNIVVCCHQCNMMKRDWYSCDEFLVVMKALKEYRTRQGGPPVPGMGQ